MASPRRALQLNLLACLLSRAASLRLQASNARKHARPESGGVYALRESKGGADSDSPSYPPLSPVSPDDISFNSDPGDWESWVKSQRLSEVSLHHAKLGITLNFSEVGGRCNPFVRPFADYDTMVGHANPHCRYEPSAAELARYRAEPMDLAILMPHDKLSTLSAIDSDVLAFDPEQSAHAWRAYAKFHGYAFYQGRVPGPDPCYGEVAERIDPERPRYIKAGRAPEWLKPCMALQLIRRHKYLLVVDSDTFVTKPALRMEPLFATAGLLQEHSAKSIALASEWGSCANGGQQHWSGHVNTGVLLLKHTAEEALRAWFYNANCSRGCKDHHRSFLMPAYDQFGFAATVGSRFRDAITVLPSGCPINSPWGDFISHLVSGSFNKSFYDPTRRGELLAEARRCTEAVLQRPSGLEYHRCSLCDLWPSHRGRGFDVACPRR